MKVLDVFAGCGGLSLGLIQAGYKIIAACEIDKWAAETYASNHPGVTLFRHGIQELSSDFLRHEFRGEVEMVAGGPPCQGFSVSGKRQYGVLLDKNQLIFEFARVVEAVCPKVFVMENVRGFTTATIDGSTNALGGIRARMQGLGYHVYHVVLQAADYGVPQFRSRVFVIGSLTELHSNPFPAPTHSLRGGKGKRRYLSVGEAISDLPPIKAREGTDGAQPYTQAATNQYQREMRIGSETVNNHEAMKHSKRLVERFSQIPPGGSGYKIGRSEADTTEEAVTVYKSNNQRLIEHLPSLCITANFQSTYIHPTLDRNLTAREGARIMTFPDRFILRGKRTAMSSSLLVSEGRIEENYLSQYNQLGNAVPPLLARLIGEHIEEVVHNSVECFKARKQLPHQLPLSLQSP